MHARTMGSASSAGGASSVGVEGGYEELWKWSVANADTFWPALMEFTGVEFEGSLEPTTWSAPSVASVKRTDTPHQVPPGRRLGSGAVDRRSTVAPMGSSASRALSPAPA